MRKDIFELIEYATSLKMRAVLSRLDIIVLDGISDNADV